MHKDFKFGFEGLTQDEEDALKATTARVAALAAAAAKSSIGDRVKWFGSLANNAIVSEGLKTMSTYINEKCTRLTYVRKHTGQIIDQVKADPDDYGQVIPNISTTVANFVRSAPHVTAGLRIFAMNEIINAITNDDEQEKINYVYHEISHKVLDTVDYKYGEDDCKALAKKTPTQAVRNADNWGYYIAELDNIV